MKAALYFIATSDSSVSSLRNAGTDLRTYTTITQASLERQCNLTENSVHMKGDKFLRPQNMFTQANSSFVFLTHIQLKEVRMMYSVLQKRHGLYSWLLGVVV